MKFIRFDERCRRYLDTDKKGTNKNNSIDKNQQ